MQQKANIVIIFILLSISAFCQEKKPAAQVIEDIIEEIAASTDEDLDYTQLAEALEYYYESPLNLNTCTPDELDQMVMLNDFQKQNILNYRNQRGKFLSIYELQLIEGLDYPTIKLVLPFVTINNENDQNEWKASNALKYGNHEIFLRTTNTIQNPVGYANVSDSAFEENPNSYYPGSKYRVYTRYKFNYKKNIQWGITAEKDPGEQFFAGEQKYGFDFYSAHLQIKNVGHFKTITVGDYQAQLGQGLIMWSYLSNSKTSYVLDVRKTDQGLKKYSSTDENAYLRGAGTTIQFNNFLVTLFASYKKMDANVQQNDTIDDFESYYSSLDNTGIHATPNQIAKKDAISESLGGSSLTWQHSVFKIGINAVALRYDIPIIKDSNAYNQYSFSGKENYNASTDFQLMFKGLHVFGEAAISRGCGKAVLVGALMQLAPQLSASIIYRNYGKDFHSVYGNAFSEGSTVQNEEGFYLGAEVHPVKNIKVSAYYDVFKFPWLKQQASALSKGQDFFTQIDYLVNRKVNMYARIKNEIKEENNSLENNGIATLGEVQKTSVRYHINYTINDNWSLKNRVEWSYYQAEGSLAEQGILLYQDVVCSPFLFPLDFTLRYALFETDSYNSRIYTYESDVLYAYSVPALYDQGTRFYLVLHYQLLSKLDIWLKYDQTWYPHKTSIGSGLNEIEDNVKSEIRFQLRLKI